MEGVNKGRGLSERWGEAYNYSTFGEVVHGRRKRVFDSQREIPQGAMMKAVNCHRHDIDHEMAKQAETLKRLLSARKLEHLRKAVRGRQESTASNHTSTNSQAESCNSGWKRLMCAGT